MRFAIAPPNPKYIHTISILPIVWKYKIIMDNQKSILFPIKVDTISSFGLSYLSIVYLIYLSFIDFSSGGLSNLERSVAEQVVQIITNLGTRD
jgi:hypothetical protein